jgi:aspartate carbamoyltransferase catalytic subunit
MVRHLLSIHDLSREELFRLTDPSFKDLDKLLQFRGTLAFLFLQPSLRTMGSFANAGALLGLAPMPIRTTGDTFRDQVDIEDEIDQLGLNSRCVVARTSLPLPAHRFAHMRAPLVNAGDGSNEHPTQALIDLTALRQLGVEGKRVVMMGNVRDYRVHHSLVNGLANMGSASVELLCPPQMPMEAPYLPKGVVCTAASCEEEADEVLSRADFVYMTPTQHFSLPTLSFGERFSLNRERAERVLKPQAKVLHPFPRLKELAFDLDRTSFDGYHSQAALATPVRQRLLAWLLSA